MTTSQRPAVLLVADDSAAGEMLHEWLVAAGFEVRLQAGGSCEVGDLATGPPVACLVRWPCALDLAAQLAPVVLLYEAGADLRGVGRNVVELIELPDTGDVQSLLAWSSRLGGVLWALARRPGATAHAAPPAVAPAVVTGPPAGSRPDAPIELVAIGISTGGPTSLRTLFEGLGGAVGLPPILIVQHIPDGYVADLAARLGDQCGYDVQVARPGVELLAGSAYISPGCHHVRVVRVGDGLRIRRDDGPAVLGHRPSVGVMFDSCVRLGGHGVAIMMTGMGRDGADEMRRLRDAGWATIGQDRASCAIYGMPQAALQAGAIQRELPLQAIAPWLLAHCRSPRPVT